MRKSVLTVLALLMASIALPVRAGRACSTKTSCPPSLGDTIPGATSQAESKGERRKTRRVEMDMRLLLWKSPKDAEKYLGKIVRTSPPRIPAEGWLYEYASGNSGVGSKSQILRIEYRFKQKPKNWREALEKVGLPTDTPPADFGGETSYIWSSGGVRPRPIYLNGRKLEMVVLFRDLSRILVVAKQRAD